MEERIAACVVRVCGCDDRIIVGMITRQLAHSQSGSALETLLNVVIGASAAAQLSREVLEESQQKAPATLLTGCSDGSADASRRVRARGLAPEFSEWPFEHIGPLPTVTAEALRQDGPWGCAARGVVVQQCNDRAKGMGVFADRSLSAGELVGLYWGERLTRSEYLARHGEARDVCGALIGRAVDGSGARGSLQAVLDRATAVERQQRLAALAHSKPTGKRGAYCFLLPANAIDVVRGEPFYCVDAEDPNRSSWTRFLNHAAKGTVGCNVDKHISVSGQIWFVANRDVAPGTELCFEYTGDTQFGDGPS